MNEKVTGKQVVTDCITLAKDLGLYIADLSKRLYAKLKCALESDKKKTEEQAAPGESQTTA